MPRTKVNVTITRPVGRYRTGETVAVDEHEARYLVASGHGTRAPTEDADTGTSDDDGDGADGDAGNAGQTSAAATEPPKTPRPKGKAARSS